MENENLLNILTLIINIPFRFKHCKSKQQPGCPWNTFTIWLYVTQTCFASL